MDRSAWRDVLVEELIVEELIYGLIYGRLKFGMPSGTTAGYRRTGDLAVWLESRGIKTWQAIRTDELRRADDPRAFVEALVQELRRRHVGAMWRAADR
jgi:hypothetical protein